MSALALLRDNGLPIVVFDVSDEMGHRGGRLGRPVGTLVTQDQPNSSRRRATDAAIGSAARSIVQSATFIEVSVVAESVRSTHGTPLRRPAT